MNQLANIFFNSKEYIILHCLQTTTSIFVIFIQREYPCVFWLVFMLNRLYSFCDQFISELTSSPSYKRRYVILYTKTRDTEVAISIMESIGMTEYF
jgi:hypothetical protein